MALSLTPDERDELERRVRTRTIRAEDARRARVILMLAEGASYSTIETTVACYRDYVNRWRKRFLAHRVPGLQSRYHRQPPSVLTPAMQARIMATTRQAPPDGSTHWSTRKLARLLQINHNHPISDAIENSLLVGRFMAGSTQGVVGNRHPQPGDESNN